MPSTYPSPSTPPFSPGWRVPSKSASIEPSLHPYHPSASHARYTSSESTPSTSAGTTTTTTSHPSFSPPPSIFSRTPSSTSVASDKSAHSRSSSDDGSPAEIAQLDADAPPHLPDAVPPAQSPHRAAPDVDTPHHHSAATLRAKTLELAALHALASTRLRAARENFATGVEAAREVQRDLERMHGRVRRVGERARGSFGAEYGEAEGVWPGVVDEED